MAQRITHVYFYDNGTTICLQEDQSYNEAEGEPWFLPPVRERLLRGAASDKTMLRLPGVLWGEVAALRKMWFAKRWPLPLSKAPKPTVQGIFFYPNGQMGCVDARNVALPGESYPWFLDFLRDRMARGVIDNSTIVRVPALWTVPVFGLFSAYPQLRFNDFYRPLPPKKALP
jgi:hypothetical protein